MNLSAENMGRILDLVEGGFPLKASEIEDLHGHNDQLAQLLEARFRLMLGVEIERDQLKAENKALRKLNFELRGAAKCENLHHCLSEQHDFSEPCKVLDRIDSALGKEEQS